VGIVLGCFQIITSTSIVWYLGLRPLCGFENYVAFWVSLKIMFIIITLQKKIPLLCWTAGTSVLAAQSFYCLFLLQLGR
jgi:hypothetical protein